MQWGNEWTNPVMDEPSTAKPPLGDTAIPRRPGTGTSACVWERARQGEIRVGEGVRLVGLVGPPPPWDWVGYRERERERYGYRVGRGYRWGRYCGSVSTSTSTTGPPSSPGWPPWPDPLVTGQRRKEGRKNVCQGRSSGMILHPTRKGGRGRSVKPNTIVFLCLLLIL